MIRTLIPNTILALLLFGAILSPTACQLPGQRSAVIQAQTPREVLERCAKAAEGMHFTVKAIDHAHLVVVAEGRVEGSLSFHEVRLSIKVVYLGDHRYKVEAITTSSERGIRAGAEKKARDFFFRELEEAGGRVGH
ncbi:MAG: hypothetical protein A2Y95_12630 [Deltaproteobacteria bacterium RBG_13_65_10]|nr:MAG: hypothetical protein A2Y95_12630 [Deltaproteobacteria bacterium RBG_13_65_10]